MPPGRRGFDGRSSAALLGLIVRESLCLLSVLVLLGGCLPTSDRDFSFPLADPGHDAINTARVSCFLHLENDQGPAVRLEIEDLEILAGDLWLPLGGGPLEIDSAAVGNGQLFLAGQAVPPGRYHRLRLIITKGEVRNADGTYTSLAREPFRVEVDLTADLNLEAEDSRCLLIGWDVLHSLQNGETLQPALTVTPALRQLPLDLIFVSCPNIDTIFVVRADTNWVVESFGLKGGPTYLAVEPNAPRQLLYVLASRDRMVKVVDIASFRVVDFFPVPLNDEPTFFSITPDGQTGFLLDERNGYLSRMDLSSGAIVARTLLGDRPKQVIFLETQNLLAVTLSLSQKVLLLDPLKLNVIGNIVTGSKPQGMVVADNQLYVAEYGDDSVSITDLTNWGNQRRLSVGLGPRRLAETDGQIFVANHQGGSLSILVPGHLGVVQEIYGIGLPLEMAFEQFYRRLYVADEETGVLAVVDTNSNKMVGQIVLGAKPFGLATIQ